MHDSPDSYSEDRDWKCFFREVIYFCSMFKVARYWLSGLQEPRQCLYVRRVCTLCSLLCKRSRKFWKIPFILSSSEEKNYCMATHEVLSGIGEKLFFCITDKRKEEIDHLNYSQAADLSSFKVEGVVVAAYFPLCKHWYVSPGTLKLLKPFDKSFSPSDMVVKWLCAFIPL